MKHILLVNQFAAVKYLAKRFAEYPDIFVTALYTVDLSKFDSYLLPTPDLFNEQIHIQSDNAKKIIKQLGKRRFEYVVNGFELSVKLGDELANYYTPQYANNIESYQLRSNKYAMHKILEKNNIPHINQFIYNITDHKLPSIEEHGISYPFFIKPLVGALTIGACRIDNVHEFIVYKNKINMLYNPYQNKSNQDLFLIAELVEGEEVLADTFSIEGKHHIVSIQKYSKNRSSGKPLYEYSESVRDKDQLKAISQYIEKVLDVTEFKNGFAHTELFLLPDNSLKLIEINPRVSGASGFHSKISMLENGCDQVSLLMKCIFNFEYSPKHGEKFSRYLVLNNLSGKPLFNLKTHLKKYSNVIEILQLVPDGHIAKPHEEINLSDVAAFVLICADSLQDLEKTSTDILNQDKKGWG